MRCLIRYIGLITFLSLALTQLSNAERPLDIPLGLFHPYDMHDMVNYPASKNEFYMLIVDKDYLNQQEVRRNEQEIYEYFNSTFIINSKLPFHFWKELDLDGSNNHAIICDINPDGLYNYATQMYMYKQMGNKITTSARSYSNMNLIKVGYRNIAKQAMYDPYFGGFWLGEEPFRRWADPPFTRLDVSVVYPFLNEIIDDIRSYRGDNPNAPIVTGNNPANFLTFEGVSRPSPDISSTGEGVYHYEDIEYYNEIAGTELDDNDPFFSLEVYGKMIPWIGSDFFDECNGWDVFYTYSTPMKDWNIDTSSPDSSRTYGSTYDGGSYQKDIHQYMYGIQWVASKIYNDAVQGDGGRNKEYWYMMMPDRIYHDYNIMDDLLQKSYRRKTEPEFRAEANLALAYGAKGLMMYSPASTYYYGTLNAIGEPDGYTRSIIDSVCNNEARDNMLWYGALDGTDYITNSLTNLRKPWTESNPENILHYPYYDTNVGEDAVYEISKAPYDYISHLYSPNGNYSRYSIRQELAYIRNLSWITACNSHEQIMKRALYPETYYQDLFDNNSYYDEATNRVHCTDINGDNATYPPIDYCIGHRDYRFQLYDIIGDQEYVYNGPDGHNYHQDFIFCYNSTIYVGFYKWPEKNVNEEYYYLVNTKTHQPSGDDFIAAGDQNIQLVFLSESSGLNDPLNGTTWEIVDVISEEVIDSFEYDCGIDTMDFIELEAGEGRIICARPKIAGLSGTIASDTTWSGTVRITGNVTVSNGVTLTILPGTRVLFDGKYMIKVFGRMVAVGTSSQRISFYPVEENPSGISWNGIIFQGGIKDEISTLEYCDIRDANIGVACMQQNEDLHIKYSTIKQCTYGIYKMYSYYTKFQESKIADCDYGIVDYYSSDNSWIRDCIVYNIERTGVDIRDGVNALLYGNTIQYCGYDGIELDNINQVNMRAGYFGNNPNIIRYNGYDDPNTYRGINASDCYFNNLLYTHIYENLGTGILLESQTSVNNNGSYSNELILANNALELERGMLPNIYNSQVLVNNGCSWNFYNRNYDFIDKYSTDATPTDATYMIAMLESGTHDVSGNYFGNADGNFDYTEIPNNYYFFTVTSSPPTYIVCNQANTNTSNTDSVYWQIFEVDDSPQSMLDLAYSLMDSAEAQAEVEDILDELIELRFAPALRAMCCLKREMNEDAGDIASYLDGIPCDTVDTAFNMEIEFAKASSYLMFADFPSARNTYENMLLEDIEVPDSIRAELGLANTDLLELAEEEIINAGLHVQGLGTPLTRRITVEDRIGELRAALYNFYNGIRTRAERPLPTEFALEPAYPNPFNPSVTVPYALPKTADVQLTVYNVLGQRVVQLVNRKMNAGYHQVIWDGRSQAGLPVASGVYFVTMEAGSYIKTQKIVMVK